MQPTSDNRNSPRRCWPWPLMPRFLPSANKVWGKVMFLHLSVSHSVYKGAGQKPTWADTLQSYTPVQTSPYADPLGETLPLPAADTMKQTFARQTRLPSRHPRTGPSPQLKRGLEGTWHQRYSTPSPWTTDTCEHIIFSLKNRSVLWNSHITDSF